MTTPHRDDAPADERTGQASDDTASGGVGDRPDGVGGRRDASTGGQVRVLADVANVPKDRTPRPKPRPPKNHPRRPSPKATGTGDTAVPVPRKVSVPGLKDPGLKDGIASTDTAHALPSNGTTGRTEATERKAGQPAAITEASANDALRTGSGPSPEPSTAAGAVREPEPEPTPTPTTEANADPTRSPGPEPEPTGQPTPQIQPGAGTTDSGSSADTAGSTASDAAEPDAEPDNAEPDNAEPDNAEPDNAEPDNAEPSTLEQPSSVPDTVSIGSEQAPIDAVPPSKNSQARQSAVEGHPLAELPTHRITPGVQPPVATATVTQVNAPSTEIERKLPAEVHRVQDPAALRRHEREREHTRNFLIIFIATIGVGLMAYAYWLGVWAWPFGSGQQPGCYPGTPTPTAAPVKQTSVRVLNATDRRGLALNVAKDLQKRGFLVPMWDNDTSSAGMKAPAEVRHGPDGLLNARTVAAQVGGTALLVLDADREGPTVDLVLGRTFSKLRSPAEAAKLTATPTEVPDVCPSNTGASAPGPSAPARQDAAQQDATRQDQDAAWQHSAWPYSARQHTAARWAPSSQTLPH